MLLKIMATEGLDKLTGKTRTGVWGKLLSHYPCLNVLVL